MPEKKQLINFGHYLSRTAREQLDLRWGKDNWTESNYPVKINFYNDIPQQIADVFSHIKETLTPELKDSTYVVLPGINIGVLAVCTTLIKLFGDVPQVIIFRKNPENPVEYIVKDIIQIGIAETKVVS